jgi:hypothetical protein
MLDKLTVGMFVDWVGSTFRIRPEPDAVLEVVLIEATPLGSRSGHGGDSSRREPFSLVFRGPRSPWLPQRIHRIEHEKLGAFDFFLVPIGPDQEGMRYQAIFN